MEVIDDWYDFDRGWENTNPKWFEHSVPITNILYADQLHKEVLHWLFKKMDRCLRHARWIRLDNEIRVKFRYERDYLWFKLSF